MDVQNNIGTKLCYEGLVNYEIGDIVPCLAESWEFSDDGTALTFHLKEGVTFHDGTPFNAEAVKTDFEFAHPNPNFSNISAVAKVESIEVVDEYTVTFHYPNAYFAYLMDFCYPETMVLVSPAVLEEGNYQSIALFGFELVCTMRSTDRNSQRGTTCTSSEIDNFFRIGISMVFSRYFIFYTSQHISLCTYP